MQKCSSEKLYEYNWNNVSNWIDSALSLWFIVLLIHIHHSLISRSKFHNDCSKSPHKSSCIFQHISNVSNILFLMNKNYHRCDGAISTNTDKISITIPTNTTCDFIYWSIYNMWRIYTITIQKNQTRLSAISSADINRRGDGVA